MSVDICIVSKDQEVLANIMVLICVEVDFYANLFMGSLKEDFLNSEDSKYLLVVDPWP